MAGGSASGSVPDPPHAACTTRDADGSRVESRTVSLTCRRYVTACRDEPIRRAMVEPRACYVGPTVADNSGSRPRPRPPVWPAGAVRQWNDAGVLGFDDGPRRPHCYRGPTNAAFTLTTERMGLTIHFE